MLQVNDEHSLEGPFNGWSPGDWFITFFAEAGTWFRFFNFISFPDGFNGDPGFDFRFGDRDTSKNYLAIVFTDCKGSDWGGSSDWTAIWFKVGVQDNHKKRGDGFKRGLVVRFQLFFADGEWLEGQNRRRPGQPGQEAFDRRWSRPFMEPPNVPSSSPEIDRSWFLLVVQWSLLWFLSGCKCDVFPLCRCFRWRWEVLIQPRRSSSWSRMPWMGGFLA